MEGQKDSPCAPEGSRGAGGTGTGRERPESCEILRVSLEQSAKRRDGETEWMVTARRCSMVKTLSQTDGGKKGQKGRGT